MSEAAPTARGVYKPRRPQASPLFRLVSDHLHRLQTVYDDRFAREYGPWRPVVAQVARVAARTVPAAVRTLTGERELAVGIVACLQTHGSRANWHPHLHLLVTDGGFRPDGTFVTWPVQDTARLTEAFRRAVLRRFVRWALFDEDQAAGMLTWPHSGFHGHTAVWVPEDDRTFATRLARYCARNPVALERLTYDRTAKAVRYRSGKSEGPTAGTETADPLEFLARALVHILDKGQVTTRYYGWYANRPRGMRRQAEPAPAPPAIVPAPRLAPTEASRRWAALLRQIFEVDPLACPACHGAMRIVAFITQTSVIDQILTHLRTRAAHAAHAGARSPHRRGPPRAGGRPAPHVRPPTPRPPRETGHPTPRALAGTFTMRGRPTVASPRALPPPITRPTSRPRGPRGTPEPWRTRRRPSRGAGEVDERAACSPSRQRTPMATPIPHDRLRQPTDAPTIGLILCQTRDRLLAKYSFAGIDKPIGISTYKLTRALPAQLKSALPTVEEIEAELRPDRTKR